MKDMYAVAATAAGAVAAKQGDTATKELVVLASVKDMVIEGIPSGEYILVT